MTDRGQPKVVYEGWLLLRKKHDATQWRMRFFQLFDSHELVYHKTDKRKQHVVRRIDLSSILHIHRSVQPSQDGGFFQLDHCISIGDPKRAMKALSSKSFAPYFLDIVADDRTWSLRFPDSDARDSFFQDLQIYVCDHLDFFAYQQGPVWFQDPASHSWVESYGVCTACYFVLFESYEQYEFFLQEQNHLSDRPEQRLLSLKQRPCLLVPLRICSSEPREEVCSPTQTAPALIAKYTFCVDCSGTTLHFAVDDETDFSKWLRTIKSSLAMFQLNANITTFSSTATRSPSLRPDLDTSAPDLPVYSLTVTQSDPSNLSSALSSLAIPAPSTHRSHRNSHSMSSIALSSTTLSHAPSAVSISALSPESSLSSPPRSQRTTPSGSFISNATSTRRAPVAALPLRPVPSSHQYAPDRDRQSGSDTDAAPQVDEAAIKQVADQLRAALKQSTKTARRDSRHRHSSSASASAAPRRIPSSSSSTRHHPYPLAHTTNVGSPASASGSPPTRDTVADETPPAPSAPAPMATEKNRHVHSHHSGRASSPRGSPVSMLRDDDAHSAHSGHSSHRYSRHSSTDGTSDSESGTPSEVMENFRMSLLAAHLSLFKEFLKTGQVLMKYSGNGRSRARRVRLEDGTRLHWNRHSSIDIKDILQIVCPRDSKHNSTSSTRKSDRRCFSIITSSETINLEAPSSDYRDYWVHGLRLLMADARK